MDFTTFVTHDCQHTEQIKNFSTAIINVDIQSKMLPRSVLDITYCKHAKINFINFAKGRMKLGFTFFHFSSRSRHVFNHTFDLPRCDVSL